MLVLFPPFQDSGVTLLLDFDPQNGCTTPRPVVKLPRFANFGMPSFTDVFLTLQDFLTVQGGIKISKWIVKPVQQDP
jgi:hypothetical protein